MLFRQAALEGIAAGKIQLAFRRWRRPTVKAGGRLRTAVGELAIAQVAIVDPSRITLDDARRAGYVSLEELNADLRAGEEPVYRIVFRLAGPDKRIALRERADLDAGEIAGIAQRLERLDHKAKDGAWTQRVLDVVSRRPEVRASDLAEEMGLEKMDFKLRVRKLKDLGLTESLEAGYRLSPRGRVLLDWLRSR